VRRHLIMLFVACFVSVPVFAQTAPPAKDRASTIDFAQQAALRAVNFREGDAEALTHARADFTPDGWTEFMKHMEGWLDQKGAPTFTSSFVPSGAAMVRGEEDGTIRIRIPGTLKQTQGKSSTTYRAALDVQAGGQPVRIKHLEQIACVGASTTSPCGP
jgi:hypothetical protein